MFGRFDGVEPRFDARANWLIEEKLKPEKLEEIIDWLEHNRGSQWYGEAALYIEDLLCDREARVR